MADSNITKQALSNALKELLEEKPFEKISISDICQRCQMNRKSFYYHFRDKYDLVNWIFDTEFITLMQENEMDILSLDQSFDERRQCIEIYCRYFYENRLFYRRVLAVEGQNSFVSHFREFMYPILRIRITELLEQDDVPQMVYDFVVDGIACAIKRWLMDKNCAPVEEFMYGLKRLVQVLFVGINKRILGDPKWLE